MKTKLAILAVLALGSYSAFSQTTYTTTADGDYSTSSTWLGGVGPASPLSSGNTAVIVNNVTYSGAAHGDFIINNGATLEISSGGTFTHSAGGNWFQLGQGGDGVTGGNVLVNGGTFNQDTASSNPFNITGVGNTFTITSGAANFDQPLHLGDGLTFSIEGGTVTGSGELDYNNTTDVSMSGGVLNVPLLTGINNGGTGVFTFSGGVINTNQIYSANIARPVNFTIGSTGVINFVAADSSLSTVQGWVNNGGIAYNDTAAPSEFTVSQTGGTVSVELASVPEPSVFVSIATGAMGLLMFRRRKA